MEIVMVLWKFKFPLAILLVVLLGYGFKTQMDRASAYKEEAATAVEAHDALVKDWDRQKKILSDRELQIKIQEVENAKLHKRLADALKEHREWADTLVPASVIGVLRAVPETPLPSTPAPPPASPRPFIRWWD